MNKKSLISKKRIRSSHLKNINFTERISHIAEVEAIQEAVKSIVQEVGKGSTLEIQPGKTKKYAIAIIMLVSELKDYHIHFLLKI